MSMLFLCQRVMGYLSKSAVFAGFLTLAGCNTQHGIGAEITDAQWSGSTVHEIVGHAAKSPAFRLDDLQDVSRLTPDGQTVLGMAHYYQLIESADSELGLTLLDSACSKKQYRACAQMAQIVLSSNDPDFFSLGKELHLNACEADNKWGCAGLVFIYAHGLGTEKDLETASHYADLACENLKLGPCAYSGATLNVIPDAAKVYAEPLLIKACEAKNAIACENLGNGYVRGYYGERSDNLAREYFESACADDQPWACVSLIFMIREGHGETQNIYEVLQSLARHCETGFFLGRGSVCQRLASFYLFPDQSGVDTSAKMAFKFMKIGCEARDMTSCQWLADSYRDGKGTKKDLSTATKYYRWLCDNNDEDSCRRAAETEIMQETGGDQPERGLINQRACDLGVGEACRTLAWTYASEAQTEKDLERALDLFRRACDRGVSAGCVDLGSMYDWSMYGVREDKTLARLMYYSACQMGDTTGCEQYEYALNSES